MFGCHVNLRVLNLLKGNNIELYSLILGQRFFVFGCRIDQKGIAKPAQPNKQPQNNNDE